jgi:hypothetical protein
MNAFRISIIINLFSKFLLIYKILMCVILSQILINNFQFLRKWGKTVQNRIFCDDDVKLGVRFAADASNASERFANSEKTC